MFGTAERASSDQAVSPFPFGERNPLTIDHRGPGNSPSELSNSAAINFYLKDDSEAEVTIAISDASGDRTFEQIRSMSP